MFSFQNLMKSMKGLKETNKQKKELLQQVNFYKALSETYKTKSDFMEDTLRDILHYKLQNPDATTKDLNERGHAYVNLRKRDELTSADKQNAAETGFSFKPVEVDFASQYLADIPAEEEVPFEMGFVVEGRA